MNELISGCQTVAAASVADAVDKVFGKRGYMHSSIKPRINDKRVVGPAATVPEGGDRRIPAAAARSTSSTRRPRVQVI